MNPTAQKRALIAAMEDHLTTGERPRIPAGGHLVWRWFLDLSATRGQGFAGPLPITSAEIDAYGRLTRWHFRQDHIDLILALDRTYLNHVYANKGEAPGPPASNQSLSAAAFDAMVG
jgi:hypothetical protein